MHHGRRGKLKTKACKKGGDVDGGKRVSKFTKQEHVLVMMEVRTVRHSESVEKAFAIYESGSLKSTPKKKVTFSAPEFNFESGDKTNDRQTLDVVAKGKRVAKEDCEVNTPKRPQQLRFLSKVFCSSYAKHAVKLTTSIANEDSKLSEFVFAAYENHW